MPFPAFLTLLLLLLANGGMVLGDTTDASAPLFSVEQPDFALESKLQRFGQSALRHAQYDHSPLSRQFYKHTFGKRVNAMLKSVLPAAGHKHHPEPIIQHHMLPMRDGTKLSTLVIFPPGMTNHHDGSDKRGAMMSRSPYAPTSDQIADLFTLMNGFVAIVQDQRGTFLSEGEFTMWTLDAEDGQDTLNWALAQPWSDGRVFGAGISADGCSLASMFRLQPAPKLSGALYMWSSADGHETTYPGGSFREGLISGWMAVQSVLTRGTSLTKTLPLLLDNWRLVPGGYWDPIQGPGKFHQVNWPTVHITGWSDIFQGLQIDMYNQFRAQTGTRFEHTLIVGALGHCSAGMPVPGDAALALVEARAVQLGFGYAAELFGGFDKRGTLFRDMLDRINIYVMGSQGTSQGKKKAGHYWSSFNAWPVPEQRKLYLRAAGRALAFSPPADAAASSLRQPEEYIEYVYNPARPTTTHGGNNFVIHLLGFGCGSMDQTKIERRQDVAVFELTDALEEDLVLTGEVLAVLYVSTDAKDTDFHVSLNDVSPDDGSSKTSSMQIRSGLQRLRLKDSTQLETVVTEILPGEVYRVEVKMWFTSYIVSKLHKLRVVVSSSNTPYYARNTNTADETDQYGLKQGVLARNRVYASAKYPSHVVLPVVQLAELPRNPKI